MNDERKNALEELNRLMGEIDQACDELNKSIKKLDKSTKAYSEAVEELRKCLGESDSKKVEVSTRKRSFVESIKDNFTKLLLKKN